MSEFLCTGVSYPSKTTVNNPNRINHKWQYLECPVSPDVRGGGSIISVSYYTYNLVVANFKTLDGQYVNYVWWS